MQRALVLALMMSAIAATGCFGGSDADDRTGATDRSIADVADSVLEFGSHDHRDATLHAFANNVELVGYHNGADLSSNPNAIEEGTYYTELAVQSPYVYMARQTTVTPNSFADEHHGGFVILDISDPTRPFLVGDYEAPGGGDIEISSDGQLVFFATQRNTVEELTGQIVSNQQDTRPLPRGIHVVDVSDPTTPELAFFMPLPVNGPHTLTYFEHNGAEYLSVQTYDLLTDTGGQIVGVVPITQRLVIYQITSDPLLGNVGLFPVAQFQLTGSAPSGKLWFPHDAIPQVHPNDGRLLHYVAYWDKGVQILDLSNLPNVEAGEASDPPAPLEVVGAFTVFHPSSRNNIHLAKPFDERIAGKHVTVAEPEIIQAQETGFITFIDTSAPDQPTKLGHWTLPGDPELRSVQDLDFSPHNFDTFDGKVALAHNHAGLWIIDASTDANLEQPKTVGYFLDTFQRDASPRLQPYFWGAFEHDGLIYAVDEATGLYVLRYTGP